MLCTNIVLNVKTKKNYFCRQYVVNFYFSWNTMNNLLSYCGLTDSRTRDSDTDLPVELVYKPRFGTWFLLVGPFGQLGKKRWIWVLLINFCRWSFNFLWAKKMFFFFENTLASALKRCIKWSWKKYFFFLKKIIRNFK